MAELAWKSMKLQLSNSGEFDNLLANKNKGSGLKLKKVVDTAQKRLDGMKEAWLESVAHEPIEDLSDDNIRWWARYTEGLPLKDYEQSLDLVPQLVNLVSLADAVPLGGCELPFDLHFIASKLKSASYFAPRRFTALQLAFDEPRSRVLLFHTGRIVGTGCTSQSAAKLAVARTLHAIATYSGVYIGISRFAVINQVGAASLNARIDCDAFANTHTTTSHFDRDSFVGLAWRPIGESVAAETYSTGKTNLPGSRRERHMLCSWARMVGELYRHSDQPDKAFRLRPDISLAHKPPKSAKPAPIVVLEKREKKRKLDMWADSEEENDDLNMEHNKEDANLLDLDASDAILFGDLLY